MQAEAVIFGEALVDVFADRNVIGGAPFNVARHLAGLGRTPLMISRILNLSLINLTVRQFSPFWKSPPVERSLVSRT